MTPIKKCFMLTMALLVSSCNYFDLRTTNQARPIEELLIDVSSFPSGWVADPEGPSVSGDALAGGYTDIARTSLSFTSDRGFAFQEIYEYTTVAKASEQYNSGDFNIYTEEMYSMPQADLGDQLLMPNATISKVACERNGNRDICHTLAQYGRYLTVFVINVIEPLEKTEFQHILQAIDAKMETSVQD